MNANAAPVIPGPLERTSLELERLRHAAAFRRARELRARMLLRESDALMQLIEDCRVRRYRIIPSELWVHIVRFVGGIDRSLRDHLGIDRRPTQVSNTLFAVQQVLMQQSLHERRPTLAEIIELFPQQSQAAAQ